MIFSRSFRHCKPVDLGRQLFDAFEPFGHVLVICQQHFPCCYSAAGKVEEMVGYSFVGGSAEWLMQHDRPLPNDRHFGNVSYPSANVGEWLGSRMISR